MKKRALSLLMSLVMLVSMLPTTAWAADTTETTNEVSISSEDLEEVGSYGEDNYPAYCYKNDVAEEITQVTFVALDESATITTTQDSLYPDAFVTGSQAPLTQEYSMNAGDESWKFNEGFSAEDFDNCYAYCIVDSSGNIYYVIVRMAGDDFTATIGNGEPLTYTTVENGYSYTAYGSDTPTIVDLYKVQIPVGTTAVDLSYKTNHLTYNYRATGRATETNPAVASDYLYGWVENYTVGSTTVSVPVDYAPNGGESDGLIDYIQVQNPYGGSTYGELLYAITFEYAAPFTATSDGSPLNVTALDAEGYDYSYGTAGNGPLYTVTVPKTAKSVELGFPENRIIYNYNGNGTYLSGYSNVDFCTGSKQINGVKLDSNGDQVLDYIQVQKPYIPYLDEKGETQYNGGDFVCAIRFVYPDGTTGTPSPATPSGNVSFADLINGIASSYATDGAGRDDNTAWITADMAAFAETYPGTTYRFTKEQKQDIVNYLINVTASENPKPSDLAKSIIALISMGYDPNDLTTADGVTFSAVDKLVAMINDENNTTATNIYTLPFEIIALKQYGLRYDAALDKLRKSALAQAIEDGGWGYVYNGVTYFDADATTFVLQALAPYYYNETGFENITTAINQAKGALIRNLSFNDSGAVVAYGNPSTESTAQLILALTAMGEDPKNNFLGKDLTKGLMSMADGSAKGFQYSGALNAISTEQGFRGLLAIASAEVGTEYSLYHFDTDDLPPAASTNWAQNAIVSFKTIPSDATVVVKRGEDEVAMNDAHNAYDLPAGDYTYTVSKDGYVTKTGSFTITAEQVAGHEKQTIHVSLVSAGSGSGSSSKDIKVTAKVMVPPADQSKRYTYKHDSRSYTNLLTTTSKVTVAAGSSVRDAFVTILDQNGIDYVEQDNGYFPTIGGWSEYDRGANSGWMYRVNGSVPSVALKDYELTGNATIVWYYTDDYSNDYGSESWNDNSSSSSSSGTTTTPTTPANPVPDKTMPFTDVKSNDWYYQSVQYAYDNGLFSGVSHDSFAPGDSMDRSMLVTVLHSLDGKPAAGKGGFTDVADGAWYANAVAWAAEHGIVSGVSDSAFAPNGAITREQLAVMLYRYAQYKGYDVSKTADLSGYADQGSISDWAAQAVQWACGSGLMTGRSANSLAPAGTLTRAEAATMLKAFCENVKK